MKSCQRQMKASQTQLESDFKKMNKKFQNLEKALEFFERLNEKIGALVKAVKNPETNVKNNKKKIVDLENHSHRNNPLVFCYHEQDNKDGELLEQKIITYIFKPTLGVWVPSLEGIHRIGRKRRGSFRPVILRLFNVDGTKTILNNCKKLKGSNLGISFDYAKNTVEKPKLQWINSASERASGNPYKNY